MTGLDGDVLSLDVAEVAQPVPKRLEEGRGPDHGGAEPEDADTGDFRWYLRVGGARQRQDGEHQGDEAPELSEPTPYALLHCSYAPPRRRANSVRKRSSSASTSAARTSAACRAVASACRAVASARRA